MTYPTLLVVESFREATRLRMKLARTDTEIRSLEYSNPDVYVAFVGEALGARRVGDILITRDARDAISHHPDERQRAMNQRWYDEDLMLRLRPGFVMADL